MSWEADKQLVRGGVKHNLAIGEPEFLRYHFEPYYPRHYPSDLEYPDTKPSAELECELRKLHPEGHIVVTVGAKQALHAAIWSINNKNGGMVTDIEVPAPFWPTYPSLAEHAHLGFNRYVDGFEIKILTSPNNPDGKEFAQRECYIWDAAYAHSVYGWSGAAPKHKISVWSAGKMLGSTGVRVGWLVTQDEQIAKLASRYVEQTTSGVALSSQHHVAATLRNTENIRPELYEKARKDLILNYERFDLYIGKYIDNLATDRKGMFAWFKAKDPEKFAKALETSGVAMVTGKACGLDEAGVYRASMGRVLHQDAVVVLSDTLKEM